MLNQGVELVGLYLSAPWGCCDKTKALKAARQLGIPCQVVKMTQEYIGVIRAPKYGYGSSMNPCIDCRIYMFKKADELMKQIGADFLVTGEVLGQRPMSQHKPAMLKIEEDAGLGGRVVRPLSAKMLPETDARFKAAMAKPYCNPLSMDPSRYPQRNPAVKLSPAPSRSMISTG